MAEHVTGIVQSFLDTENIRLLPWLTCSLDLSPTENIWSMVAEMLARHHTPINTVDELVHRVEATWAYVPVHAIQSLIDAMPRRISGVITLKVVVLGTDFSGSMHLNFLKI
ncbi:uncharacterized protein TNCV_4033121 [Trichonephila clavipes]|nr:uncharacterized protein TNCV_4033121 [Trichonephila clavipes]